MSKDKQKSKRFARLARIFRIHGKYGEVSARCDTDELMQASSAILDELVQSRKPVWLAPPALENRCLIVNSIRGGGGSGRLIIHFDDIDSRAVARDLVGRDILVEQSSVSEILLAQLDSGQDLAAAQENHDRGLEVQSASHGYLGKVVDVIETGANLVWVVGGASYGEVLLPVIDECVLSIDREANIAQIEVMKGLIDD